MTRSRTSFRVATVRAMARQGALLLIVLVVGCAHSTTGSPRTSTEPIVVDVRFIGNRAIDSETIAAGIGTQPTAVWPWSQAQRLDPLTVANDERRIEALYGLHGYYSAVVEHEVVLVGPDRVRVLFRIQEGKPTHVASLEVKGIDALPPDLRERARASLPLRVGDVMVHDKHEAARDVVERRLRDAGYARAEVEGRIDAYPERREARVTLTASPGPLHRYGDIRIEGLVAIPSAPVRAIVRRVLPPGDRYSANAVDEAQDRVNELGAFRSVRVRIEAPRDEGTLSTVVVHAEELPVHSVVLGGGVGVEQNLQQLRLVAEYGSTSFLGGARRLTWENELALRFLPTFYDRDRTGVSAETSLEVSQPEIFDRTSLAVRGTYERAFREAYKANRVAARVGLIYRVARRVRLVPAAAHERYLDFLPRTPVGTSPLPLDCPSPCQVTYVSLDVIRDRRDRTIAPTRGYLVRAGLQYGFPLPSGGFHYLRAEPEVRTYASISGDTVIAARAKLGVLFPSGGRENSPLPQRFFGGGEGGHRGFGPEQLAPLVEDAEGGFIPIGGDGLWLTSLELRWRLTRRWELVPFADYGDVTIDPLDIDLGTAHLALGLGVRLFTLAGPVRLDVSYRVPRRPRVALDTGRQVETDSRDYLTFFLSLGEAF